MHEVTTINAYSKAGLMARAAADPAAAHAMVLGTGAKGLRVQHRTKHAGSTASIGANPWNNDRPIYLRLERRGKEFTGSYSYDKKTWTVMERARPELGDEVLVGLSLSSHITAEAGHAVFSDWELIKQ